MPQASAQEGPHSVRYGLTRRACSTEHGQREANVEGHLNLLKYKTYCLSVAEHVHCRKKLPGFCFPPSLNQHTFATSK